MIDREDGVLLVGWRSRRGDQVPDAAWTTDLASYERLDFPRELKGSGALHAAAAAADGSVHRGRGLQRPQPRARACGLRERRARRRLSSRDGRPAAVLSTPADTAARRGVLEVLAAAVLFGTTGTTASFAPATAGGVAIGAARLVIGGATLLLAAPAFGGRRRRATALWREPWGLAGALMVAAYQLAFFAGVALAGVALGTLVTIGSGPLLVGLLSWTILRERPSTTWWTATAICLAGLMMLTLDGSERAGVDLVGLLLALMAGLAYALYTLASKRLMVGGERPEDVMPALFGLGGLLMVPVLLASGVTWLAEPAGLAVALWLGVGTIAVAYLLFGRGLRELHAGVAATLVLAEPLVATLLGVTLLGEQLGSLGWLGAALVALGLAIQGLVTAASPALPERSA